jgi:hypothetical protein
MGSTDTVNPEYVEAVNALSEYRGGYPPCHICGFPPYWGVRRRLSQEEQAEVYEWEKQRDAKLLVKDTPYYTKLEREKSSLFGKHLLVKDQYFKDFSVEVIKKSRASCDDRVIRGFLMLRSVWHAFTHNPNDQYAYDVGAETLRLLSEYTRAAIERGPEANNALYQRPRYVG